jgi:nucleoside-diphosphate-sugar epimerase
MNIFFTTRENEENTPPAQASATTSPTRAHRNSRNKSSTQKKDKTQVLEMSRRFTHANSARATFHHNDNLKMPTRQTNGKTHRQHVGNGVDSPAHVHKPGHGWCSNGNGVFVQDVPVNGNSQREKYTSLPLLRADNTSAESSNSCTSPDREGLKRRSISTASKSSISWGDNSPNGSHHVQRSPSSSLSPRPTKNTTTYVKRRMAIISLAVGLALIGYFVEIHQMMHMSLDGTVKNRDWLMNLPRTFPASFFGGDNVGNSNAAAERLLDLGPSTPLRQHNIISMSEEWKKVHFQSQNRAEQRRMRTMPPSTYPTIPLVSGDTATGTGSINPNVLPPRLTLNLPAHRELQDNGISLHRSLNTAQSSNNVTIASSTNFHDDNSNLRRRLSDTEASQICGPNAREASQLNPNSYPPAAYITSRSRVVITGALTQVGMELILQLYEDCGVNFIVGIDALYPNTRHSRVEMIESRYEYIQRRVPGFQRMMVPNFGLHPHPKIGEELRFESMDHSFDLVSRLAPTHIVHLADMEEGYGEYTDYGDTAGASPFVDGGKSSMMRRFDSLLSMEQIFSSVAKVPENKPKVVFVSSNEASNQSGVSMQNGNTSHHPHRASVYGTSSLVKEVLASYYYHHHGVDSVGLRVPTVFGPFARPGSLMYDLTQRTIYNAAGKDVDGIPTFHLERDRFELPSIAARRVGAESGVKEQLIFVFDAASAIISAMQFQKHSINPSTDTTGPTLLKIGSKLTSSMKEIKERLESHLPPRNQLVDAWPTASTSSSTAVAVIDDSSAITIYESERNRNLLGWTPKTGLHKGTKTMLAWHILKMYPYGIPSTVPSYSSFVNLLEDSLTSLSYHSLPCASGCRWKGGMCSSSPWDAVIETTKDITQSCAFVLYTVDLRPELANMEKQSTPSQRRGWESYWCKIAFVSSSSKLARGMYADELKAKTPMNEWNGSRKAGHWIVVTIPGTQYSMPEFERSLGKLAPNKLFHDRVEKAMYVNHLRVIVTTDQAMGVVQHLEMSARKKTEKKTIVDKKTKENVDIYLPPQPQRHSVFFTNKYNYKEGFDTSNAKNLGRFVMSNAGIAETRDIRTQIQFYEEAGHLTRTNQQRSPNYQDFYQDNFFPFDFIRSTWLVHELKSEAGRNLRCEMYEEHALWGNREMEDLSMAFVLAKRKVKMQLGKLADNQYAGPEEWYPLLVPKKDEVMEGPVYLDYLEPSQKIATNSKGHEYYITFLPQKGKE